MPADAFGDSFDLFIRQPIHLSHLTHRGAGLKKDLAGYHGGAMESIFFEHISNNVIPLIPGEININIRHVHPLRMNEAFKLQIVADRVNLSDK